MAFSWEYFLKSLGQGVKQTGDIMAGELSRERQRRLSFEDFIRQQNVVQEGRREIQQAGFAHDKVMRGLQEDFTRQMADYNADVQMKNFKAQEKFKAGLASAWGDPEFMEITQTLMQSPEGQVQNTMNHEVIRLFTEGAELTPEQLQRFEALPETTKLNVGRYKAEQDKHRLSMEYQQKQIEYMQALMDQLGQKAAEGTGSIQVEFGSPEYRQWLSTYNSKQSDIQSLLKQIETAKKDPEYLIGREALMKMGINPDVNLDEQLNADKKLAKMYSKLDERDLGMIRAFQEMQASIDTQMGLLAEMQKALILNEVVLGIKPEEYLVRVFPHWFAAPEGEVVPPPAVEEEKEFSLRRGEKTLGDIFGSSKAGPTKTAVTEGLGEGAFRLDEMMGDIAAAASRTNHKLEMKWKKNRKLWDVGPSESPVYITSSGDLADIDETWAGRLLYTTTQDNPQGVLVRVIVRDGNILIEDVPMISKEDEAWKAYTRRKFPKTERE